MSLVTGLEKITYGVEDLNECKRFFTDLGLEVVEDSPVAGRFRTLERSVIELRSIDDPVLPPAFESGSTIREVIWGVAGEQQLEALAERISQTTDIEKGPDGIVRCTDPAGLRLGFQPTRVQRADVVGTPTNRYGHAARVNEPSTVYERAQPIHLSHFVIASNRLEEHLEFYLDVLQFHLSDSFKDLGYFMRSQPEGGHHNIFVLNNPAGAGLNHVSFMVRDVYEVFGGGINMDRAGWSTQIGPGRHIISSAIFWYFHCPAGGTVEYYADEDYLTAEWEAREIEPDPSILAEWSIAGGIDAQSRQQKKAQA